MFLINNYIFAGNGGQKAYKRRSTARSEVGFSIFVIKMLRHEDEFQITTFWNLQNI